MKELAMKYGAVCRFSLLGYQVTLKDTSRHASLFSQRNGYGCKRYVIGKYLLIVAHSK